MKRLFLLFLLYTLIVVGLPLLITSLLAPRSHTTSGEPIESITTYIAATDKVEKMDFSAYLCGVVAAEMPASFHEEALRAQAVAARSYTLLRREEYLRDGIPAAHKGAYTCTDPNHCKAWISEEELRARWGADYEANMAKIQASVHDTASTIMTYNGALVNAVFHSTSAGQTENARDVWGGDVPYLVSVASYGDELSPRYSSKLTLSAAEYKSKLKEGYPEAHFDEADTLIGEILRSQAGGIKEITTGGITLTGNQFRELFGLRSTNVQFTQSSTAITMDVTGNGHGVGMSQYGANYLASQGKTYEEILKTYYSGVTVEPFSKK